jgi:hypothetical protein
MSHDQNFKNLILDYPREALAFFASEEAAGLEKNVRITPLRQEQLKERLGERFRELDVPLLVEWPDGRREALLFVIEQETQARRFDIHRLVHYCVDLAVLCDTDRVVPVVIFLDRRSAPTAWSLGGDRHTYLHFHYLAVRLADIPYVLYRDSDNIVARINLPNMAWRGVDEKIEAYAAAIRGLLALEPDFERRAKYVQFVDIYGGLDDNERRLFEQRYPQEGEQMVGFAERFREEGRREMAGFAERFREEGRQEGAARSLLLILENRFGTVDDATRRRLEALPPESLEMLIPRALRAESVGDLLEDLRR